jgi:hypothetical protein
MPVEHSENWYLKKHGTLEVFGPVSFEKIREWADSSQINAQDALSTDQVIWTKAPMVPEMEMDWLIVVGDDIVYGPTTAESLLEFERLGEINARTALINCRTGQSSILAGTPFYQSSFVAVSRQAEAAVAGPAGALRQPGQSGFRVSLQQRIRELENALLEERRKLGIAEETSARLEGRVRELEDRIRDYSGFRRG